MKDPRPARTEAQELAEIERDPVDWLFRLLEESGAKVTFSVNCRSGIIGSRCQCWRCRKERGQEVTPETEALAARMAVDADRDFDAQLRAAKR